MTMNHTAAGTQSVKQAPELDRNLRSIRQRSEHAAERLEAMLDRFVSQPKDASGRGAAAPEPVPTYEVTLNRIEAALDRVHTLIDSLEHRA